MRNETTYRKVGGEEDTGAGGRRREGCVPSPCELLVRGMLVFYIYIPPAD